MRRFSHDAVTKPTRAIGAITSTGATRNTYTAILWGYRVARD